MSGAYRSLLVFLVVAVCGCFRAPAPVFDPGADMFTRLFDAPSAPWSGYGDIDICAQDERLRGSFEIAQASSHVCECGLYASWGAPMVRFRTSADSVTMEFGEKSFVTRSLADSLNETGLLDGVNFTFAQLIRILTGEPVEGPLATIPDTVWKTGHGVGNAQWRISDGGGSIFLMWDSRGPQNLVILGRDSLFTVEYSGYQNGWWNRIRARDNGNGEFRVQYKRRNAGTAVSNEK